MATPEIRDIEQAVEHFLNQNRDNISFTLSQLTENVIHTLAVKGRKDQEYVEREAELILGASEDFILMGSNAYPKQAFFHGTRIRVVPTAFELEKNILFPGARFAPFCSPEIFYDEYQIREKGKDRDLETFELRVAFKDFAMPYLLLGRSGLIDALVAENDENRRLLRAASRIENTIPVLTVYDMTDFYREHGFQQGDSLILTVEDWQNCVFSMEYQAFSEMPDKNKQDQWLHAFEQALLQVCVRDSDYWEIPDQISHAYVIAYEQQHDLRHQPFMALEEYQLQMQELSIRKDNAEWLLVPADDLNEPGDFAFAEKQLQQKNKEADPAENPEPCHHQDCDCHDHHHHSDPHRAAVPESEVLDPEELKPDLFSASSGVLESMDAILTDLRAPVNEIEVIAMIQDALSNGEENFEAFRSRFMDFAGLNFVDEAQDTAFLNFLEDAWEINQEYFNPGIDSIKEPLRVRLLDLTRERIDTIVNLLEFYQGDVPADVAGKLKRIHRDILETLSLLNSDSQLPEDAAEQLELRVGDLEDQWDEFTESFGSRMGRN